MANNPTDQIAQMENQIAKFDTIAQRFADEVAKGGSKYAEQAKTLGAVYEKIAAEQAHSVELMKEMAEASEEIKTKAKELEKLRKSENEDDKKKAEALTKELKLLRMENEEKKQSLETSQKEIKAVQDKLKEMAKVKTSVGELGKEITKTTQGWAEHLVSADALKNAFKGLTSAAQDFADIQIQAGSYTGMTGNIVEDIKTATPAIVEFSVAQTKAQVKMAAFGYSAEEAGQTFKKFANLTLDPHRMEEMASATGALSKMLGISLADSVQYVSDQQLKYNQTAEQSAAVLLNVKNQTEQYNKAAGMQVMRGRDVVKVLFDISAEGKMVAQDQVALEKMLSSNLIKLQSQGQNYQEALEGASMYVKKMTTEAPEWTKILAGRELLDQMSKLGDLTSAAAVGQTKEMQEQLDAASPGLAKRVQDLRKDILEGTVDEYSGQRMMQEMLQGTEPGMKAMRDQFASVAAQGVQSVKAVYGVSEMEARRMMAQNKSEMKISADLGAALQDPSKTEKMLADYKLTADEIAAIKSSSLTTTEKEGILQKKQDELNLAKIKEVEEKNKQVHAEQLKAAKELYEKRKKEGAGAAELGTIQHRIQGLEGSGLNTVTSQLTKAAEATQQILGGNWLKQLDAAVKSPIAQMATGLASVTKGIVDYFMNKAELAALSKIALGQMQTNATLAEIAAASTEGAAAATEGAVAATEGAAAATETAVATTATAAETGVVAAETGVTAAAVLPLAIPVLATAAAIAGLVSLLNHWLGNSEKEGKDRREAQSKNTQSMLDKRIEDIKAGKVAPGVNKDEAIARIQQLKQQDINDTAALNKQYSSTTMQKTKALFHMGDLYAPQAGGVSAVPAGSVSATPVSAAPQTSAPLGAPGSTGGSDNGAAQGIQQMAEMVPGSQGNDIRLTTIIPFAKTQAANMHLMQQFSTTAR
jgi:hypothetical protein